MTESKLFMSSCSRRQLARRRPGRAAGWVPMILLLVLVAAGLAAFLAGRGSL